MLSLHFTSRTKMLTILKGLISVILVIEKRKRMTERRGECKSLEQLNL